MYLNYFLIVLFIYVYIYIYIQFRLYISIGSSKIKNVIQLKFKIYSNKYLRILRFYLKYLLNYLIIITFEKS